MYTNTAHVKILVDFPNGQVAKRLASTEVYGEDRVQLMLFAHRALRGRFIHRHKARQRRRHSTEVRPQVLMALRLFDISTTGLDADTAVAVTVTKTDHCVEVRYTFNTDTPISLP